MSEPIGQTPPPSSQVPPVAPAPFYRPSDYSQQQQWMPAPPPGYLPQPRNGYGVTALVLAIVGLVFSLVPLTGFIALICGGLAVLFGLLGLGRVRRGQADNKGLTITGLVLGALALVLGFIGVIIVFTATNKLATDLSKIGQPSSAPPSVTYPQPQVQRPTWTLASTAPTQGATPRVVNAKTIGDDYEANKIAAERKWNGQFVQFTSEVGNISDGFGGPSVSFTKVTSKFSFTQIVCRVTDENQLVSISKGHAATVRGVIDGDQTFGVISLKDCEVVG